jgi:hypothetical protein
MLLWDVNLACMRMATSSMAMFMCVFRRVLFIVLFLEVGIFVQEFRSFFKVKSSDDIVNIEEIVLDDTDQFFGFFNIHCFVAE